MATASTTSLLNPSVSPHRPASFTSSLIGSAMVLVSADGELDASNARGLAEYVDGVLDAKRRLIVDLRELFFFGTQGFSSLHYINVSCSRRDVSWVAVPGTEVSRVLRICDPGGLLPMASSLEGAIGAVSRPHRRHLRPLRPNQPGRLERRTSAPPSWQAR
jgi:anti-anti-sigma factor